MVRLGAALTVVAIGLLAAQRWQAAAATGGQPPAPVATVLPVMTLTARPVESYARQRSYTGLLREARRSQLSFQRGGELLDLTVDDGAHARHAWIVVAVCREGEDERQFHRGWR